MTGAPRKPASKFPQLRKQMQKNQIVKNSQALKALRQKPGQSARGKGRDGLQSN